MTAGGKPLPCEACPLRAELRAARDRIRELEDTLQPRAEKFWPGIRLSPSDLLVLQALVSLRGIMADSLSARLKTAFGRDVDKRALDVIICRLRGKLRRLDPLVRITTVSGWGYRLSEEDRDRLLARRTGETGRPGLTG